MSEQATRGRDALSGSGAALCADALVWDCHACLPLHPGVGVSALERHRRAGVDFVSVNVGMDFNPVADILQVIASFRADIARRADSFVQVDTLDDVFRAKREGKLAVAFDLEGSVMLGDNPEMVALFQRLGVRQIHLAYNRNNSVAGGCHDQDMALTALGREVVAAVNRAGLLMDCSHTGYRSSLDIMACSTRPVIYSHANPRALADHPRNIRDDQIDACAATGGVIGINGIGLFLGDPEVRADTLLRNIDYVAERVGVEHVGLGLDYMYRLGVNDSPPGLDRNHWWPRSAGYAAGLSLDIAPPERIPEIAAGLLERDYGLPAARAILGGNFLRVAAATWIS